MEPNLLKYAEVFLKNKEEKISESTMINYKYYLNNFIVPYFWNKNINQISIEDVTTFRDKLIKQCSNQVAKNIYSILKQLLDLAVIEGDLKINYARFVKIENEKNIIVSNKKNEIVLNDSEINAIYNYCISDLTIGIGIILALKLGIRKGEIISLKWADFNLVSENPNIHIRTTIKRFENESKTIVFKRGKTKTRASERLIPLSDNLITLLDEYKKEYKTKFSIKDDKELKKCFLIVDKNPKEFISPNKIDYYFRKMKKKIGLRNDIHFHSLRHTFVTKAIVDKDIPLNVVKYIVGHSTSASITIDTYAFTDSDIVNKYRNKL